MHLISAPRNLLISLTSVRGAKILIYAPTQRLQGGGSVRSRTNSPSPSLDYGSNKTLSG